MGCRHAIQKLPGQLFDILLFPVNRIGKIRPLARIEQHIIQAVQLLLHIVKHNIFRQGNHFKAAICHDDPIIVAVAYLFQYLLPHHRLKGLRFDGKNLCFRIQVGEYLFPLTDNVIRYNKQILP